MKEESQPPRSLLWVSRALALSALVVAVAWGILSYLEQPETPVARSMTAENDSLPHPGKDDLERWLTQGETRHVHQNDGDSLSSNRRGEVIDSSLPHDPEREQDTIPWDGLPESLIRGLKTVGIEQRVPVVETGGFRLSRADGSTFSLEQQRGRWVLLNFWASWCLPCREEMPALERLAERLPSDRFQLIGVNVGEEPEQVEWAVDELGITFPVVEDRSGDVAEQYDVRFLPTSWLIAPDGRVFGRIRGAIGWDEPPAPDVFEKLVNRN